MSSFHRLVLLVIPFLSLACGGDECTQPATTIQAARSAVIEARATVAGQAGEASGCRIGVGTPAPFAAADAMPIGVHVSCPRREDVNLNFSAHLQDPRAERSRELAGFAALDIYGKAAGGGPSRQVNGAARVRLQILRRAGERLPAPQHVTADFVSEYELTFEPPASPESPGSGTELAWDGAVKVRFTIDPSSFSRQDTFFCK